jgi:hypothetical protein
MKKSVSQLIFVLLLLLSAYQSRAQIEVSTGIDTHYPVLFNSNNNKINYGQFSFGMKFGVAYKPPETQFFPILNLTIGRTRLPLQDIGNNVAALNFNYLDVMLNENYVVRLPKSQIFIYGGIGFTNLNQKGLKIMGSGGESMESAIDSVKNINHAFPAVNIGFEVNSGVSADKELYLTMGLNFQYILLLSERNTYYITVKDQSGVKTQYTPSLTGGVISPGFYIAIHYMLPHFKKSGMYL